MHLHYCHVSSSASDQEDLHLGGGELHTPLIHCRYEFPTVTNPLLHVNKATVPSEIMYILPLSGSLSGGHLSFPTRKKEKIGFAYMQLYNMIMFIIVLI